MMGENAGIGAVLRSDFLDSLVNMYPKEQASFQKRLESYTDSPGSPLQLKFTDGTTAEADGQYCSEYRPENSLTSL